MKKKRNWKYSLFLVLVISSLWLFRLLIMDVVKVSGTSMLSAYKDGDMVLVQKSCSIQRYDVVVINAKRAVFFSNKYIKRVIGLPGDILQIREGQVYVNGEKLDDVVTVKMDYAGIAADEIIIGAEEYFVLGDNRNNSYDSRYEEFGIINKKDIWGKVVFPER
ncbi:MAG: signal peptidase I [Acetatifactor sp.]|nr:signal peptidase I [Acetatifactor sp.]